MDARRFLLGSDTTPRRASRAESWNDVGCRSLRLAGFAWHKSIEVEPGTCLVRGAGKVPFACMLCGETLCKTKGCFVTFHCVAVLGGAHVDSPVVPSAVAAGAAARAVAGAAAGAAAVSTSSTFLRLDWETASKDAEDAETPDEEDDAPTGLHRGGSGSSAWRGSSGGKRVRRA